MGKFSRGHCERGFCECNDFGHFSSSILAVFWKFLRGIIFTFRANKLSKIANIYPLKIVLQLTILYTSTIQDRDASRTSLCGCSRAASKIFITFSVDKPLKGKEKNYNRWRWIGWWRSMERFIQIKFILTALRLSLLNLCNFQQMLTIA